jgi:hypothetical protein
MRNFIKKILIFILPALLLIYPVDYLISYYLSRSVEYSFGETKVWKDIYSGKINSDIIIYGSSRALVHVSSKIFEDSMHISTYNLGINGHNFWLQYLRHKELLKFNKKPKLIILSLDIFTLQKRIDLYDYNQFLPFMLWNDDIKQYTSSYIGFSTYDYYVPLIRYNHKIDSFFAALKSFRGLKPNLKRIKGYMGMERNWNNDLDKAKSKVDYYEIKIDTVSVMLFEQFINECKYNGTELILIYSPEYIEGQNYVINRNEIISKYQYFAQKYNLQFIDYSNDKLCMQKQFFYNAQHLNKKGSEIFTKKLIKDIKARTHNIVYKTFGNQ